MKMSDKNTPIRYKKFLGSILKWNNPDVSATRYVQLLKITKINLLKSHDLQLGTQGYPRDYKVLRIRRHGGCTRFQTSENQKYRF